MTSAWEDVLYAALSKEKGETAASQLSRLYNKGFSAAYTEDFTAQDAVKDIAFIEALNEDQPLGMDLYGRLALDTEQLDTEQLGTEQKMALAFPQNQADLSDVCLSRKPCAACIGERP